LDRLAAARNAASCGVGIPFGAASLGFHVAARRRHLRRLQVADVVGSACKTRAELAVTNPTWKKWSDDKTAIRKEKAAIQVLSLNRP